MAAALGALADAALPQRHGQELTAFGQQDGLFHLAVAKQQRLRRLQMLFSNAPPRRLLLSPHLAKLDPDFPGWEVASLDTEAFSIVNAATLKQRCASLAGSVVVLNNNDLSGVGSQAAYCALFDACAETLFIGWDWDNHHWLDRSTMLAAYTDLYAPGHQENLFLLTRYNAALIGPVPCASVQWSRRFLNERLVQLLQQPRSNLPLGMHIPYASFSHRNRIISTLSRHYNTVGFSDPKFHARSAEERLLEWAAHKAHWIVPVLNDVPIRIFDALITGGVPLIPSSLRHLAPVAGIGEQHVVFYGPADVVEPQAVVARANAIFDKGGLDGVVVRHRLALDLHHGNVRLAKMLDAAALELGWDVAV